MKLLANENFPLSSVKILENAGYDIISVGKDFAFQFELLNLVFLYKYDG